MKKKSFAKVNLSLDVVKKRDDGYHELDMIMVPIDLFDTVSINIAKEMSMVANKSFIPLDERNTIIKAIEVLRDKYDFVENFEIELVKNTPTQGGMGGGSANAATTITMINEMLNLKMSEFDMMEVAKKVGADVPFCVYGKPARVMGFGEILKPIEHNLDYYMFIIKPKWGVSTPQAFKNLDLDNLYHPKTNEVVLALENSDYQLFIDSIDNTLEAGAIEIVPQIKTLKAELLDFGFDVAIMSGSGSTVFGISQDENLVDRAVQHFVYDYNFVKKTKIIKDVRLEEIIEDMF